jgi:hypothetical protein
MGTDSTRTWSLSGVAQGRSLTDDIMSGSVSTGCREEVQGGWTRSFEARRDLDRE